MPHPKKIVLHCPRGYQPRVDTLVEEFMRDGVTFVGVVGPDCARVEDIIDELVVRDGTREPYFMLTSSHPGETVADAVEFAEALTGEHAGEAHVIEVQRDAAPNGGPAASLGKSEVGSGPPSVSSR